MVYIFSAMICFGYFFSCGRCFVRNFSDRIYLISCLLVDDDLVYKHILAGMSYYLLPHGSSYFPALDACVIHKHLAGGCHYCLFMDFIFFLRLEMLCYSLTHGRCLCFSGFNCCSAL